MRLPGTEEETLAPGGIWTRHFMTNFYGHQFDIPLTPFKNSDENGYYKFYNSEPIQIKSE